MDPCKCLFLRGYQSARVGDIASNRVEGRPRNVQVRLDDTGGGAPKRDTVCNHSFVMEAFRVDPSKDNGHLAGSVEDALHDMTSENAKRPPPRSEHCTLLPESADFATRAGKGQKQGKAPTESSFAEGSFKVVYIAIYRADIFLGARRGR